MPRDLDTPAPRRLTLPGPAGSIAATLEAPAGAARAAVLHLHPHTTGGGTRRNNVVRHGALGSVQAGCAALRIDFRGAGESEGVYDEGRGEVEDAEAAWNWLGEELPGLPRFIWGFSFGSRVGLDLGIRLGQIVAGYCGVAWPTAFYPWPEGERPWPRRMAFLAGDLDEYVDLEKMEPAAARGGSLTVVRGAGHFFELKLGQVRGFTADTLRDWL